MMTDTTIYVCTCLCTKDENWVIFRTFSVIYLDGLHTVNFLAPNEMSKKSRILFDYILKMLHPWLHLRTCTMPCRISTSFWTKEPKHHFQTTLPLSSLFFESYFKTIISSDSQNSKLWISLNYLKDFYLIYIQARGNKMSCNIISNMQFAVTFLY